MKKYIFFLFICSSLYAQTSHELLKKQVDKNTGSVIKVPEDQKTIQQGIDAAQDGDTVIVADGTYTGEGNRDIVFNGKAIVVRSENGYENCIIDCEGKEDDFHFGFVFYYDVDRNTVLEGFTIKNAYLRLTDCMFDGSSGGGILVDGSPIIRNNKIINNRAAFGAGICSFGEPLIENNIISNNVSTRWGGGLNLVGNETVIFNQIESNTAADAGGGIWIRQSGPSKSIINNIICNNHTAGYGGGIALDAARNIIHIAGNLIVDNVAEGKGGGLFSDQLFFEIDSFHEEYVFNIVNNSIVNNVAEEGGGIYNANIDDTITNCIFQLNNPQDVYNCNITYSCLNDEVPGTGNICQDLEFITVNGLSWITDGSSPCVNAGNPDTAGLMLPGKDILGNERIINDTIDIGANEVNEHMILSISDENNNTSIFSYLYPNPSNDKITIKYNIPYEGEVTITINDISGRLNSILFRAKKNKGVYEENFDISPFSPGIYFIKYKFNNVEKIHKLVVK